jgi:phosphatidylglycerol---prolipoprotein diacylglyceryl transferase
MKNLFSISIIAVFVFSIIWLLTRGIIQIPQSVEMGFLNFRLYGLIIGLAVIILILLVEREFEDKERRIVEKSWPIIMIFVLFGARLWHVATDYHLYQDNILGGLEIWNGGLSIFGGLIGGVVGMIISLKIYNRLDILNNLLAKIVFYLPLAQSIGRLGNLVNQELFGQPTNLPWGMFVSKEHRPIEFMNFEYFHPAFLYEIVGNLIVFGVMFYLSKINKLSNTLTIGVYLFGYGIVRSVVNLFRLDIATVETVSAIASVGMILLGGIIIAYDLNKRKKTQDEN